MCIGVEIALAAQIAGGIAGTVGTGVGVYSAHQQGQASKKAERLRAQQLRLKSQSERRAAIRQFQLQRATSLSNIVGGAGSAFGGGSAIGGLGGYTSTLGTQLGELSQSTEIGEGIFGANAEYAQAGAIGQIGSGLGQFGNSLFNNSEAIGRIGSTLFNEKTT